MTDHDEERRLFYETSQISLDSRCIRLLHVRAPEPGNTSIHCEVSVANLDTSPTYAALSYVWSQAIRDPSIPAQPIIYCKGASFCTTPNCYSAIWHLRQKFGSLTIWIDAICINQNDNNEKAHQVSMMGDIYSLAEKTYIWLGEGSTSTDRVMKLLNTCGFLEYFFDDSDAENPKRIRSRPGAAYWSYKLSKWGICRSTLPLNTTCKYI